MEDGMFQVISANSILVWLVWGFCMGLGWNFASSLIGWGGGMIWRRHP
jgi:hypothetical protein